MVSQQDLAAAIPHVQLLQTSLSVLECVSHSCIRVILLVEQLSPFKLLLVFEVLVIDDLGAPHAQLLFRLILIEGG